jgi:TPR repeat protein
LFESALAALRQPHEDLEAAVRLMKASADSGYAMASYALGTWYLFGKGSEISIDPVMATRYLESAADANIPDALYDLAVCYSEGEGVEKNDRVAFELYLRAALRGDAQSVNAVGTCYFYGIGVDEDRRVAKIWHDRAQELGTYREECD